MTEAVDTSRMRFPTRNDVTCILDFRGGGCWVSAVDSREDDLSYDFVQSTNMKAMDIRGNASSIYQKVQRQWMLRRRCPAIFTGG